MSDEYEQMRQAVAKADMPAATRDLLNRAIDHVSTSDKPYEGIDQPVSLRSLVQALHAWSVPNLALNDLVRRSEVLRLLERSTVPVMTYAEWVDRVAAALHEDCELRWDAAAKVDPGRLLTMHLPGSHLGQAHDLVRRLGLADL